jgi:hypothetical protein
MKEIKTFAKKRGNNNYQESLGIQCSCADIILVQKLNEESKRN